MSRHLLKRLVRLVANPSEAVGTVQRRLRHAGLSRNLLDSLFASRAERDEYRDEFHRCGLHAQLQQKIESVGKLRGSTTGGKAYDLGAMSTEEAAVLYTIVRKLQPEVIVETGVCNGYSSAVILQALHANGKGGLYSVDFPEIAGMSYSAGTFWDGKGGAVVPSDKQSGWLIPDGLRDRWDLTLGKSQEVLPGLLERLPSLDIFIHDSEHSYECMMFEYRQAFPRLRPGGLLVSDDISWNSSFFDFARQQGLQPGLIAGNMGFMIKR